MRGRSVNQSGRKAQVEDIEKLRKELDELLDQLAERIRQYYPRARLRKSTLLAMLAETECPGCLLKKVIQKYEGPRDSVDPWYREKHNVAVNIALEALRERLRKMGYKVEVMTEAEGSHGRVDILIRITRSGMELINNERIVIIEVKTGKTISFYQLLRYLLDHPDAAFVIWRISARHVDGYGPGELRPLLVEFANMCICRARSFLKSEFKCEHKLPTKESSRNIPEKDLKDFSEALHETLPKLVDKVVEVLDLDGRPPTSVLGEDVNYWLCVVDETNWPVVKEKGIWGMSSKCARRLKKLLPKVKQGDAIVFYVKMLKIVGGIFRTATGVYEDNTRIFNNDNDEVYPYRIRLEPLLVPDEPVPFKKLVPKLKFVKNKHNWGMYLKTSIRLLSDRDFRTIYQEVSAKCRNQNTGGEVHGVK